ncbi:MAG: polysaccharide deacetylase family protein [Pseudomonadota bacterium]
MPLHVKIKVGFLIAVLACTAAFFAVMAASSQALWLRAVFAALLLLEALGMLAALELYVPQVNIITKSFRRGDRGSGMVALSFDDGPAGPGTVEILGVLAAHGVKATFFILGQYIDGNEKILEQMAGQGHETGNHGYSHRKMHFMPGKRIEEEIRKTEELIVRASGKKPVLLRTPHGFVSPAVGSAARRLGYRIAAWTTGVWDTDKGVTPEQIAARALENLKAGDILLLHDGHGDDRNRIQSATAAALPMIIEGIKSKNMRTVPVGELLKWPGLETKQPQKSNDR